MNDPKNAPPRPDNGKTSTLFKHVSKRALFFAACAVVAIVVFCIVNRNNLATYMDFLKGVFEPIIIGCAMAYLCNPILKFYESKLLKKMKKGGFRRGLALLFTVITVLLFAAVIVALILPELVNSISHLVNNYNIYVQNLLTFLQSIIDQITKNLPDVNIDVSDVDKLRTTLEKLFAYMGTGFSEVLKFLRNFVVEGNLFDNVWGFLTTLFNTFKNAFLGIFIAFYILSSKEKRIAQIKKFRAAFLSEKQDKKLAEVVKLVDRTFGGFLRGTLLDALVVGAMVFVSLTIFNVSKYNLLIAAICAITNIIPVFGPFIGAIPSALIVLISNPDHPIKLLVFVILILVIQQVDGNIILPRIQGNNTGVSSLAVLIAITVMGGLFGVGGMIIGVPIFAVVIELVKRAIEERLIAKGAETDTTHYYPKDAIGNAEEDVHYEHAHLRYLYDHSRVKTFVDKSFRRNAKSEDEDDEEVFGMGGTLSDEDLEEIVNAPTDTAQDELVIPEQQQPVKQGKKNQKNKKSKKKK